MQKLSQHQKLLQKLSPQQIKLMKLIQLPTIALEQRVKQEMEENPALEEGSDVEEFDDDIYSEDGKEEDVIETDFDVDEYLSDDEVPDYRTQINNYSADDEEKSVPISVNTSFSELLKQQVSLRNLNDEEEQIALYLIGCIDDDGYIRRELSAIVDDLAFTQHIMVTEEQLLTVLKVIQDLDPPGVGARSLEECLVLQLQRKEVTESREEAIAILEDSFEEFTKKHYEKIKQKHNLNEDELKDAIAEISKLNPKPGGSSSSGKIVQQVVPDFTIAIRDGELELSLNGRNAPELKVSKSYTQMLQTYKETKSQMNKSQKEAALFVKQKLDSAKWFIDAIYQRQQTLLITMQSIMNYQQEYFLSGDEKKLKPMILKDIADEIGMDISTVSRVANSKYVQTPYGTKLIKDFFSEAMQNSAGEDVSTREIKKILEELIENEDKKKPLTDDKLAAMLKEKGYPIARRTIAKYREQLNIPVARLRKQL